MKHIIGIDGASEVSSVVVMNNAGKSIMNTQVVTSEKNLTELVKSVKRPRQVVFEECGLAAWFYSFLEPICDDVLVCNPKKNKDLSGHSKSDDLDAYNLADRARLGALSRVWHGGKLLQIHKERLLDYQALTKESTRLKNEIKAIFRNRGIAIGDKAYIRESRDKAVKKLPLIVLRERVLHLGSVLDIVEKQRESSRKELIKATKKNAMYKSLISMPQIGEIHASTIIATVGTASRFRTRQQFWSYCGLAVTTYETGQYCADKQGFIRRKDRPSRTRGLVREFNPLLKFTFKNMSLGLSSNAWRSEFIRLQEAGVSIANARLTLARKAAAIALHLMKKGELYDEALVFTRKKISPSVS